MDDILDNAPCGFLSFDDSGRITLVNGTLVDMLGYPRAALVGESVEKILNLGSRIFYQTHFFPLIRLHNRADEIFLILRAANGGDVAVLTNAVRHTRDGEIANDCVFIGVPERQKFESELVLARRTAEAAKHEAVKQQELLGAANHQLEQLAVELEQQAVELELSSEAANEANRALELRAVELERLRAEADQANMAKSSFLAMMSHELRTPLNAISGYAQLLEMGIQGPVSDTQRESLQRIQQSQAHLLRLVNEVLNLARIESGHVEYDIKGVDVHAVTSPVLPLVEPQMLQGGISLVVDVGDGLRIACDVDKTQQILLNLLSNAIKFTAEGGVISLSVKPADDGRRVHLVVRDTGIGIPAEMIETIFDPFVQVEMSPSRRGVGTGLGLAISRDLARGMEGDISASSVQDEGSAFTLTLPAA